MSWLKRLKRGGWIGVDLDGTLAHYDGNISMIGEPLKPMMDRVQEWLKAGHTVKLVTARAGKKGQKELIHRWCLDHGLPSLEVTDRKDFQMTELWDDRAIQVETNTGHPMLWRNHAV